MVLIFIEWPEQLELALVELKTHSNYVIIAANVTMAAYLESQGIPYVALDAELDREAYFINTSQGFEKLEKLCAELDDIIQGDNERAKQFNIRPFYYNYYYLKIWLDYLSWLYECSNSHIKTYKPSHIIYFYDKEVKLNDCLWNIGDTVIGFVLKNCFPSIKKTEIEVVNGPMESHRFVQDNFSDAIRKISAKSFWRRAGSKVVRTFEAIRNKGYNKCYFSIHPIIPNSVANKCKLKKIDINQKIDVIGINNANEGVQKHEALYKKLQDQINPDFVKILWSKIEKHIISKTIHYIDTYRRSCELIDKYNPLLLEMAMGVIPEHKIMAEAFKSKNKKVVIMQHGAMGQHPEKIYYYTDLMVATDYLVYGNGVREYIKFQYPHLPLDIHNVGNNKVKNLNRNLKKEDLCAILGFNSELPIFVFQLCGTCHHSYYNTFNSEGDFLEYDRLKQLVMKFEENKDIQLVLKFHKNTAYPKSPIESYVSETRSPNIRFICNIDLSLITNAADYFITDRPSTGMFEAMYLSKPVIAYNSVIKFWGADKTLTQACHYFTKFDEVLKFFESKGYLKDPPKAPTTEYVKQFVDSGDFEKNIEEVCNKLSR